MATACSSSGPAAPDAAAAPGAVAAVYNTLFDFSGGTFAAKEAAIQGGQSISVGLQYAASNPLASASSGATIHGVTILPDSQCSTHKVPAPCAQVKYDILGKGGAVSLGGQVGYASYVNGKWQVAKVTICQLIETLYSVEQKPGIPPGCGS